METLVRVLPVIAIVAVVVRRQWQGGPLDVRRAVTAPLVLLAVGLFTGAGLGGTAALREARPADVLLFAVGAAAAVAVGACQGRALRLEYRAGVAWTRMPLAGFGWWLVLAALRAALSYAGPALGAHLVGSGATALLFLGANRLGQAAVLLGRVRASARPAVVVADTARPAGRRSVPTPPRRAEAAPFGVRERADDRGAEDREAEDAAGRQRRRRVRPDRDRGRRPERRSGGERERRGPAGSRADRPRGGER
ncbi:hypothetical protein AB0I39_14085 [Kitasatospora purpeofusca]|uniref:hypothetical protein n=1 Tax=Kitasatospora purpeofusca TaxID=67352 RepID=UPI0033F7078C